MRKVLLGAGGDCSDDFGGTYCSRVNEFRIFLYATTYTEVGGTYLLSTDDTVASSTRITSSPSGMYVT